METLPVEIIYHIFDNLDTETLIFSIRWVSRRFRSIINTYDRYILDFNLISKSNFYIFSQLINPKNVISLILSNQQRTSDQINLFISFGYLQHFTRLRSLTLVHVDEEQLQYILERISFNFLTSLSLYIRIFENCKSKAINNLLTSIISRSNLRKLIFNIPSERLSKISWSSNSKIQLLTINSQVTTNDLITILESSPNLRILTINHLLMGKINKLNSKCFPQLTSLIIEEVRMNIIKLEIFLLTLPSLVNLRLISSALITTNGKRWEEFITMNLRQLNKFEFYFEDHRYTKHTQKYLESIISSYQTPFWIEHKKWFINCECGTLLEYKLKLYSIPICIHSFTYVPSSSQISLSTYPTIINKDSSITALSLTMNKSLVDDIQKKDATTSHLLLFPKVTQIDFHFSEDCPLLILKTLTIFIDISRIVTIELYTHHFEKYNQDILMDIHICIEQFHNLSVLIINTKYFDDQLDRYVQNCHSIIPSHIKHLQIPINDLNQIEIILEQCQNLSTITFTLTKIKLFEKIINWFYENTIHSKCQQKNGTVAVWLGKKKIPSTEKHLNHKRIKLTDTIFLS